MPSNQMSSEFGECLGPFCPNFRTLGENCSGSLTVDTNVGHVSNFNSTYSSADQTEVRCDTSPEDIEKGFAGPVVNDPKTVRTIRSNYGEGYIVVPDYL